MIAGQTAYLATIKSAIDRKSMSWHKRDVPIRGLGLPYTFEPGETVVLVPYHRGQFDEGWMILARDGSGAILRDDTAPKHIATVRDSGKPVAACGAVLSCAKSSYSKIFGLPA